MELSEALRSRRSIRKFKPDPVPDSDIKELLEAARLAPSGVNLQPWRFVVIKTPEARAKINECTPIPFVAKAPVIIACCVDTQSFSTVDHRVKELKESGAFLGTPLNDLESEDILKSKSMDEAAARSFLGLNAAISIDHLTLKAVDLGLGTCWVMMFSQKKVKKTLELDDRYHVVALIPVGYPDQNPKPRPRLAVDEILLKEL
ncbi:MAG: nitroreductase family protein [Bacillota bacterium]